MKYLPHVSIGLVAFTLLAACGGEDEATSSKKKTHHGSTTSTGDGGSTTTGAGGAGQGGAGQGGTLAESCDPYQARVPATEVLVGPTRAAGPRITTEVVFGRPSRVLVEDAARNRRDLVVVGANHRGTRQDTRTAPRLLRHCPVPLWIARTGGGESVRAVLSAVDHGDTATDVGDVAFAPA